MRFATGFIVGAVFGKPVLRTVGKIVPERVKDRIAEKLVDKTSEIIVRRIEGVMGFVEKKLYANDPERYMDPRDAPYRYRGNRR